jgi:hypothetical protein
LSGTDKKILRIDCGELNNKLEDLVKDLNLQLWNEEDSGHLDFLITNNLENETDDDTQVILMSVDSNPSKKISKNCIAVLDPNLLNHKVGQTYLRRLVGANSSVALEVQFEQEGVAFKNFRLIDPDTQGHYSDLIAKEISKTNLHPVVPRMFFDGVISYFYELQEHKQAHFPVEVDYGAFKDCFIIQMHCSLEKLSHGDLMSAFNEYDSLEPMRGLLSLVASQVDVLDIYTLESTSKLVMSGVWFSKSFKEKTNLQHSILIHDIEKFDPSTYEFKAGEIDLSIQNDQVVESKFIQKIESLSLEDIEKFIFNGSQADGDPGKNIVKGLFLSDEELLRVSGKFEKDESFIRLREGQEVANDEIWRFKKASIIDSIKDKIIVRGRVDLNEIKQIVKDHLSVEDKIANEVLSISDNDTYMTDSNNIQDQAKVVSKGQEHELLLRDAQIHKMKKLIDRMKAEILHLKEDANESLDATPSINYQKVMEFKDLKIQQLEKKNNLLIDEKNSRINGKSEAGENLKLQDENQALHSQVEMLNNRLAQMNENIETRVKQGQEKTIREVEALKRQNKVAHEIMQKFKVEKQKIETELKSCKDELATSHEKIIELSKNGSSGDQIEIELARIQGFLKDEQSRSRSLESELKGAHIELKKHEQKTKFLMAQLENIQKQSISSVQTRSAGSKGSGDRPGARETQLQRLVETMKASEEKANAELISKKDDLNKLKSENTMLQNTLSELRRKLSKYERKAA